MWMVSDPERTLQHVQWATGINVRTIYAIVQGKRASVRFDTADQILIRLGYHSAWLRDEELAEYYAVA